MSPTPFPFFVHNRKCGMINYRCEIKKYTKYIHPGQLMGQSTGTLTTANYTRITERMNTDYPRTLIPKSSYLDSVRLPFLAPVVFCNPVSSLCALSSLFVLTYGRVAV